MRRLPPFAELVAFEAVARRSSFTLAAAELHLTQSAISHRVSRLERHFGTALIRRLNPGLALTEAGAALLPELTAALEALARLDARRERRLRVTAGAPLCNCWLARRLAGFMAQRPGLSVELIPLNAPDPTIPDVDVRIHWVAAGEDAPGPTQAPLFNEQVFPVCSPSLLPRGRPQADGALLASLPLLHKAVPVGGEWSWRVWFDRLGVDARRRRGGELRFPDMGLMVSAAVAGAGVALVRTLLAHDALREGTLVVPVAGIEPMTSSKKHVARWPAHRSADPDVQAFVGWLAAEAARTLADTAALIGGAAPTGRGRARAASVRAGPVVVE